MSSERKCYVPCYRPGVGNGISTEETVPDGTPVYSEYTGNIVGYGQIPCGMMSDAPEGHRNHGKKFHVININGAGEHRLHREHFNLP